MEPQAPTPLHPQLLALLPRLQLVGDCWNLLAEPDGSDRREHYLSRGEREPEGAYHRRLEAALPSGFFRDALRTFAGMLASSHWCELPPSLQAVISDVDGRGTDLGVFLERADLLELRDGAAQRRSALVCSASTPLAGQLHCRRTSRSGTLHQA